MRAVHLCLIIRPGDGVLLEGRAFPTLFEFNILLALPAFNSLVDRNGENTHESVAVVDGQ